MSAKPKAKPPYRSHAAIARVIVQARVAPEIRATLERVAIAGDTSVSAVTEHALRDWLACKGLMPAREAEMV